MGAPLTEAQLKSRFQFGLSLRFDLFYALHAVTDPEFRIHRSWKACALDVLPEAFHLRFELLGGSPNMFSLVADALQATPIGLSFDGLIETLRDVPPIDFQRRVLEGNLHDVDLVAQLLEGKASLMTVLGQMKPHRREWLAWIGLYPPDPTHPMARALTAVVEDPERYRERLIDLLVEFWERVFRDTWRELLPQMERSLAEKERLFRTCTLEEFAQLALLRVDIDPDRGTITAIRGPCTYRYDEFEVVHVAPSAFNDKRYWACYDSPSGQGVVAYFPYFDPALAVNGSAPGYAGADPELDAALIFRALGDSTRFSIFTLIARSPMSSADLADRLGVSRATVSHHVNQLRSAGLLREERRGPSVYLSPRREVLESLSDLVLRRLYRDGS